MRGKPWLLLAVLALAVTAPGQSADVRYQPLLDNSYVNVSGIDLPPRRQATLYQNTHEVFWIALEDAGLTFVGAEGKKTKLPLKLGDTRFFRRYQAKSVLNEGAGNVRAVVVEIKARGLLSDACYCTDKIESAVCGCGAPGDLPDMWATGMGKIMVGGTRLAPDQAYESAAQRGETLMVALTPLQLLDEAADTPSRIELAAGQVTWIKAGSHKFKNVGRAPARFVSFEF